MEWIESAGNIALGYFNRGSIQQKADGSLVTEADKAIETFLVNKIQALYPQHAVISEEGTHIDGKEYTWIIDPLDGTLAFIMGMPTWCISIGILYQQQPYYGIVYLPITKEVYLAEHNKGATWNNIKIDIPDYQEINHNSVLCVSAQAHQMYSFRFPGKILSFGSGIVHSCLVMRGAAIGSLTMKPNIWDLAAVFTILQESGAVFCDIYGNQLNWKKIYNINTEIPSPLICYHYYKHNIKDLISIRKRMPHKFK